MEILEQYTSYSENYEDETKDSPTLSDFRTLINKVKTMKTKHKQRYRETMPKILNLRIDAESTQFKMIYKIVKNIDILNKSDFNLEIDLEDIADYELLANYIGK